MDPTTGFSMPAEHSLKLEPDAYVFPTDPSYPVLQSDQHLNPYNAYPQSYQQMYHSYMYWFPQQVQMEQSPAYPTVQSFNNTLSLEQPTYHNTPDGYGSYPTSERYGPYENNRRKVSRKPYSMAQTEMLETRFQASQYISTEEKNALSKEIGLKPRQVKVWFQNRRHKHRQELKRAENVIQAQQSTSDTTTSSDSIGTENETSLEEENRIFSFPPNSSQA